MANAEKFLFDSDYPMPYLTYFGTTTQTVGGMEYYKTAQIAHNLPFTPLLIGQWSTSADFSISYDLAMSIPQFLGGQPSIASIVGADSSSIWFDLTNNTGSDVTFYYRLAAFSPPSYSGMVDAVDGAGNYKFNSDFNYLKIYRQGMTSVSSSTVATIAHDLGYVPQSRIWNEQNLYLGGANRTILSPMSSSRSSYGLLGGMVNDNSLILGANDSMGTVTTINFYYHIYADKI